MVIYVLYNIYITYWYMMDTSRQWDEGVALVVRDYCEYV